MISVIVIWAPMTCWPHHSQAFERDTPWPPASSIFSIIFIERSMGGGGGVACGAIFLDLLKAFDTVDHEVLLLKLRHLGFQYSVVSWVHSYLWDICYHCTRVNGVLSDGRLMNSGVPQGAILGPLLFICYINGDFFEHIKWKPLRPCYCIFIVCRVIHR